MTKRTVEDISSGTQAWDAVMNDNWAKIRDFPLAIKSYANFAALPAPTQNDEAICIVLDPFDLWICDGTTWISIGPNTESILVYSAAGVSAGDVVRVVGAQGNVPDVSVISDFLQVPIGYVVTAIPAANFGIAIRKGVITSALSLSVLGEKVYSTAAGALAKTDAKSVLQVGTGLTTGASSIVWIDIPGVYEKGRPLYDVNEASDAASEIDTGILSHNGNKIYRKVIEVAALANAGVSTTAHGISLLNVAKGVYFRIDAIVSDNTTIRALPWYDGTDLLEVKVNATNLLITSTKDETGTAAFVILEYIKTG